MAADLSLHVVDVNEDRAADADAGTLAEGDAAGERKDLGVTGCLEGDISAGMKLGFVECCSRLDIGFGRGVEHDDTDGRGDARAAEAQAEGGGNRGDGVERIGIDEDIAGNGTEVRRSTDPGAGIADDDIHVEADADTGIAAAGQSDAASTTDHGQDIGRFDGHPAIAVEIGAVIDEGMRLHEDDVDA
ncbi:hypothetical protein D9M68_186200 [compost metagenome]